MCTSIIACVRAVDSLGVVEIFLNRKMEIFSNRITHTFQCELCLEFMQTTDYGKFSTVKFSLQYKWPKF